MNIPKQSPMSDFIPNLAVDKNWWRGAVIYQIYPRSFQDSTNDGVGDLNGIIDRLPYIASLGVDAIWISPFFTSPMQDFGYDVSNYLDVDPMFGSLSDFDRLIEKAHEFNIKIIIDLVLSHTSDEHEWFKKSRQDKVNSYNDWYVWADAKSDGTAPNNWLSIFGGSAWQWEARRKQYYLHNFLSSQPDLNFHNIDVQNALLDILRFWLDKKVDGFRFDTINFYFCDEKLRDNPALPVEKRNSSIAPDVNPYNYQDHIYDKNRPENLAFLKKLRATMNEYPAVGAVGEVGDAQYGMEIMGQYSAGDELIQMCYAFEFLAKEPLDAKRVINVLNDFNKAAPDGWACWAFSNHDVVRHASRWKLNIDGQKLFASLLLSLRGSVCLYQGEELGLSEVDVAFEDLHDPYGKEFWPDFKGRDGCRTPMVWNDNEVNGGFSKAKPWLPIPKNHLSLCVDEQEKNQNSLLSHYKKMIDFRKSHIALIKGEIEIFENEKNILTFIRKYEGQEIFCAFNFSDEDFEMKLPDGKWEMLEELKFNSKIKASEFYIGEKQAFFAIQKGKYNG